MEECQTKLISYNKADTPKTYIVSLIALLVIIHFSLNFLYSPSLKWFFLVELCCVAYYSVKLPLQQSIIGLIYLFFIEGQGRILWEYHSFFRLAFDLVCLLAVIKSVAIHKKIISHKLPLYFEAAIYLHMAWFIVQLFNVNNIGIFPALATSKIYLLPILLFSTFLLNPFSASSKELKTLQIFALCLIFLETILSWYQMLEKESGLSQIGTYYMQVMKEGVFTGPLFRPFATTMVSGAISAYLAVSVGFLFLPNWHGVARKILTFSVVLLSFLVLFLSQVRSSMIKHALLVVLSIIGFTFISKLRSKLLVPNLLIGFVFYLLIFHSPFGIRLLDDIDLNAATQRFAILSEHEGITRHRISMDGFIKELAEKIYETPLGLGPGRTGAASSMNAEDIANDPIYSASSSWTFDNLFIALAIDFGIGMIFYTFLIVGLPIYLILRAVMTYKTKERERAQIIFVCAVSGIVIVAGNWAANGLPYNPESFMFWFWMATGVNYAYTPALKDDLKN